VTALLLLGLLSWAVTLGAVSRRAPVPCTQKARDVPRTYLKIADCCRSDVNVECRLTDEQWERIRDHFPEENRANYSDALCACSSTDAEQQARRSSCSPCHRTVISPAVGS
jgi:hypothetical protein